MAPNASAATESPSCDDAGQTSAVCQSPGNYEGNFSQPVEQPVPFEYPYGWLQSI